MVPNLPLDLVEKIWLYLDVPDRVKVQRVCKAWKDHSRASNFLWTNMMYIRKEDAINPDPKKDLTILKQIRSWNNVKFEQLAIVVTAESVSQCDASTDLVEFIMEAGLKDIVLGLDKDQDFHLLHWLNYPRVFPQYGIDVGPRENKTFNCVNLRSLVVRDHDDVPYPCKGNARTPQTSLEILSISGQELYQNSNMNSTPDHTLLGIDTETIPFDNMIREARVIDILRCRIFQLRPSIVNLLEQVSNTLEYLTISLMTNFNNGRHESLKHFTLHFPNLRFLALRVEGEELSISFKTPKLAHLQTNIVAKTSMFPDLSQLQSIYVKSPSDFHVNNWLSLDPMARQNLEILYVHSSYSIKKWFDKIFDGKIFPKLRKLVVLPEELMPTTKFQQSLIDIYNGRVSSKNTIKLQTFIWCEFDSLVGDEYLKTQIIDFIKNNLARLSGGNKALKAQVIDFIKNNLAENFITVKTKDLLHSYRYSPHIMGNFTLYRNVMEKRKLFFDKDGEPRKDFSVDAPLIENMEDDKFFKNNFTKW